MAAFERSDVRGGPGGLEAQEFREPQKTYRRPRRHVVVSWASLFFELRCSMLRVPWLPAHRGLQKTRLQHEAHDGRGNGARDKACYGTRDNGLLGCGVIEKRCERTARCSIV